MTKRLWVDGCFDFFHHGHAGALLQARELGDELYVGVHSDKDIELNKGPVVMHMDERVFAVESCKWTTKVVASAPYVTQPEVMDANGCEFVVHGDDITTDADGNDCYQQVKDLGRFLVVKRTPNISTTDLIARMLSNSTRHHLMAVADLGCGLNGKDSKRLGQYASHQTGKGPHTGLYFYDGELHVEVEPSSEVLQALGGAVYIGGAFDLFHAGHLECLKKAKERGAVVVGLYDDHEANSVKGGAKPVMNAFERALCCLQCRYVDAVVIGAPAQPDDEFFGVLAQSGVNISEVAHGVHNTAKTGHSIKSVALEGGVFKDITAEVIVSRVLGERKLYEERQRRKTIKAEWERQREEAEGLEGKD